MVSTVVLAWVLFSAVRRRMLSDIAWFQGLPGPEESAQLLQSFTGYVYVMDAVRFPESRSTGEELARWLADRGHSLLSLDGPTAIVEQDLTRRLQLHWIPAIVAVREGTAVARAIPAAPDPGFAAKAHTYVLSTEARLRVTYSKGGFANKGRPDHVFQAQVD